jgi:HEAT repeat protein
MRMRKSYWIALPCLLVLLIVYLVFGGKGKSTDELIGDLNSGKERDRMIAVRTLPVRSNEAEKIVPALIQALKDKHSDIRLSAAIKLGVYGEQAKEAIPALQEALKDRDVRVSEAAYNALVKIDPNSAPSSPPAPPGKAAK